MEVVEVTAHFDSQGRITPISFMWRRKKYHIEGTGRRWTSKNERHILVMVANNDVYHLVFDQNSGIWNLIFSQKPATF